MVSKPGCRCYLKLRYLLGDEIFMTARENIPASSDQTMRLEGLIERVTYSNEESGYTVARVKVKGERDLVTVVGSIMSPMPGEVLIMTGEWTRHPQFGRQFKIKNYQTRTPASAQGIRKYLGSGLIKGIGPVMAERIVDKFGQDTLDVIEEDIDRLLEVEGIGDGRLNMIRQAWQEQKEIRRVMLFLQEHGVGSGYATRIFKQYGDQAIEILKKNPYRLAQDIFGIGFLTADRIAQSMGFTKDSEFRVRAGVLHVLHETAGEGHVYYPFGQLLEKCREILDVDADLVEKSIIYLAQEDFIIIDSPPGRGDQSEIHQAIYLSGYHRAEVRVADRLSDILRAPGATRDIDAEKAVAWVQGELKLNLAPGQQDAVIRAVKDKVLVITGGPGTGKTTIIRAVLAIYSRMHAGVMLAAPTGRAAKRMSEATGYEAKTIHRLLDFKGYGGAGFGRNEEKPLDCDLLVVDEASMIDVLLMHHLLKAVPLTATLIIVGDVDQLPSVGPGSVLRDIIASGAVPVVRLTEIFRQARESSIIVNAHRINRGQMPLPAAEKDKLDDFYFIERGEPQEAAATIIELVTKRIPDRFHLDPIDDIQVLTPMHRGLVGADNLNAELQEALNPKTEGVVRGSRKFCLDDKVMQIRNNYDKDVFNGDIGRITGYEPDRREVQITFDGREILYDFSELDEIILSYAVSVHKSQGSEFPAVVLPVMTQHYVLLQRNLIYTGVTRGAKLVVLVGSKKALAMAVKKEQTLRRFTKLAERLGG